MNINSAIGMSNSDTISFLEDYGIIEIFNNEVILDDQIIHMLEAHLIDGYTMKSLWLRRNLQKNRYFNFKILQHLRKRRGSDTFPDISKRITADAKKSALDTLRGYSTACRVYVSICFQCTRKASRTYSYNESLLRFESKLRFIWDELSRFRGFFTHVGDTAILLRRMRLRTYILDVSNTLIQLNSSVVEYIRKTNENIRFYKHLVELKELRDRREIIDKTTLRTDLRVWKRPPLNGYSTVEKPNYTIKLHPDYSYEKLFENKKFFHGGQWANP